MSEPTQTTTEPAGPTAGSATVLRRLLRAEIRKTLSTNTWWVLLLAAASVSSLVTHAMIGLGRSFDGGGPKLLLTMAYALNWGPAPFAVVYGVLCAAGEFRWRTISTSCLSAPRRGRLLTAKLVVAAAVGAGYALTCALVVQFWWLSESVPGQGLGGDVLVVSGTAMLICALWSAFGVGIGMLIRNQAAAVVAVLVYPLIEFAIAWMAPVDKNGFPVEVGAYLPAGSSRAALTWLQDVLPRGVPLGPYPMPWWLTLLIFAGYTALAVLAGSAVARRRDLS